MFHTHHLSHHFVTHHLSFTSSFVFPSFPVPATTFLAHYWKKLTCGVVWSFNLFAGGKCTVAVSSTFHPPATFFCLEGVDGRVRTSGDPPVPPELALKFLKEGNQRFVDGKPQSTKVDSIMRKELDREGQAPHTAIIGCADSRCPLETLFDTLPGDIFVLRNAGNTCTHAEGSMVGSLEFCTGKLGSRLIMVLGHTKCGAVYGATNAYIAAKRPLSLQHLKASCSIWLQLQTRLCKTALRQLLPMLSA